RDLLKKGFAASMRFDFAANPVCLLSQPELRRGIENVADAFFSQTFKRGLTSSGPREWNICIKCFWQSCRIGADLRYVTVQICAREKRMIAPLHKDVKNGCFKGWIGGVTVCFPAAIQQIDLDASVNWLAGVDANRSVAKIRSGFTVPNTDDFAYAKLSLTF